MVWEVMEVLVDVEAAATHGQQLELSIIPMDKGTDRQELTQISIRTQVALMVPVGQMAILVVLNFIRDEMVLMDLLSLSLSIHKDL